jgi:hypothetical protein
MTHTNKVVSKRTFGNVTISSSKYVIRTLEGRRGPVRSYEWDAIDGDDETLFMNANIVVDGQKPEDSVNVVALVKKSENSHMLEVTTHNGETVQITECADRIALRDAFYTTVNSISFSLGAFVGKEG